MNYSTKISERMWNQPDKGILEAERENTFIDDIVQKSHIEKELLEKLVSKIGVLIDGRYVAELNDGKCALRGSTNQNIIFYDRSLEERYRDYLKQPRKIQNFYCRGKLISVGIHNS